MITRASDLVKTAPENLRGGKGAIDMTHIITAEQSCGSGRMFSIATIRPGCSIGMHRHVDEFEIYYILEGAVNVMDNDQPATLVAGDCMLCKDGDSHSLENVSDKDAKALFIVNFVKKA